MIFFKANTKIFCGLSDHTNIQLALYKKAGLLTYYGPHFADFGSCSTGDYTLRKFQACLFQKEEFELDACNYFYTSAWCLDKFMNNGFWNIISGEARGNLVGVTY